MIKEIRIKNYKSINKLKLKLGRVNVLIGENGSGKSNILEAIALGSAAANDKLDNEFLVSRGIRVTDSQLMRSAFDKEQLNQNIEINFIDINQLNLEFNLQHDNNNYSTWKNNISIVDNQDDEEFLSFLINFLNKYKDASEIGYEKLRTIFSNNEQYLKFMKENFPKIFLKFLLEELNISELINFLIFSPKNKTLRIFEEEGQIQPLGINGEGLLKFLQFLNANQPEKIEQIKQYLKLID